MPQLALMESNAKPDLICCGSWTLLAFTGRGDRTDTPAAQMAAAAFKDEVATWLVSTSHDTSGSAAILWDLDGEIHRRYGLTTPRLVLVRPD